MQPEFASTPVYEEEVCEYGEWSNDNNFGDGNNTFDNEIIPAVDVDESKNVDFHIGLNSTYSISSRKEQNETNEEENEEVPEVIIPIVVSELITHVVEAESYNHTLERGNRSSKKRKPTLKDTHPLLAVRCCKKECFSEISVERRKDIYERYWEMDYDSQRLWISGKITLLETKRRRKSTDKAKIRRKCSRSYMLPKNNTDNVTVCKGYFLSTLGYKSDKVLTYLFSNNSPSKIAPLKDRRGKHAPADKTLGDTNMIIKSHIESFHPAVPHYRRAHAPLRRYLPPELSLKLMYDNFKETNPTVKCKERTYRRMLNDMNVGFAKLGEEDCEDCREFSLHSHIDKDTDDVDPEENENEGNGISTSFTPPADLILHIDTWAEQLLTESQICLKDNCDICTRWKLHATRAKISREEYRRDVNRNKSENSIYFASDMEKVIMLPRLPGLKKVIFTKRVILFHETFAPLGGTKNDQKKPVGVIWHEGISGRNDEDLASTYSEIINHTDYRDYQHFVFWADNCTAQNKNWSLFSALLYDVNQKSNNCQSVTMKYFEKGHTFMAADAFHKAVEDGMREKKFMYDFNDFQVDYQFERYISRYGSLQFYSIYEGAK